MTNVDQLKTEFRDQKSAASAVDPSQVENMNSFDTLSFDPIDGTSGSLVLTVIDFDSEGAARNHTDLVTGSDAGLQELPNGIGDVSAYRDANDAGIGSMIVFKKGERVVTLHTAQSAGVSPLVDLDQLATLARKVADRI